MLRSDLLRTLQRYSKAKLFSSQDYPVDNSQFVPIPVNMWHHAQALNNPYITKYAKDLIQGHLPENLVSEEKDVIAALMKVNTLKLDASYDMWGICIDQLWLEFVGTPSCRSRPMPFVESFPLSLWFCRIGSGARTDGGDGGIMKHDVATDSSMKEPGKTSQQNDLGSNTSQEMYSFSKANNCDTVNDLMREENKHIQCTAGRLADCYVVAKFGSKVRAELNHFQFLFLLRMLESFSEFQIQLNVDLEKFAASGEPINLMASLVIPDIEFAIVCPYVSELLHISHADDLNSPATSHDKDLDLEFDDSDQYGAVTLDSCRGLFCCHFSTAQILLLVHIENFTTGTHRMTSNLF